MLNNNNNHKHHNHNNNKDNTKDVGNENNMKGKLNKEKDNTFSNN